MPHSNLGRHHMQERIRIHVKHEKYPSPNKWKRILDKIMYPAGLVGPFMMIPQILKIYMEKDASSIALSSWLLFVIPAMLWVVYGFMHKEKVIMVSNVAWVTSYIFIITGAILYQ